MARGNRYQQELPAWIQTAAAYVHHQRGNPEGVERLSRTALNYLEEVPSKYRGIDVEEIREINREANQRARDALDDDSVLVLKKYEIEIDH